MKGLFGLFAILPLVGIGIYVSYRYVQWLVKGDISSWTIIRYLGTKMERKRGFEPPLFQGRGVPD